jgi:hypothetical protein
LIGVVVPAHNEAATIVACIESVVRAAQHPELAGYVVKAFVVADSCSDSTAALARACGAETVCTTARNVGIARAEGARAALAGGARWLAFTDADCVVADDWLACQLRCNTEVVCGVIHRRLDRAPRGCKGGFRHHLYRCRRPPPGPRRESGPDIFRLFARWRFSTSRVERGRCTHWRLDRGRCRNRMECGRSSGDERASRLSGRERLRRNATRSERTNTPTVRKLGVGRCSCQPDKRGMKLAIDLDATTARPRYGFDAPLFVRRFK